MGRLVWAARGSLGAALYVIVGPAGELEAADDHQEHGHELVREAQDRKHETDAQTDPEHEESPSCPPQPPERVSEL